VLGTLGGRDGEGEDVADQGEERGLAGAELADDDVAAGGV
jgi:hypothetical protein